MSRTKPKRVVLISGGGTNLQAIIDAIADGRLHAELAAVISNKQDAFGLERGRTAGAAVRCVDHRQFADRDSFDAELMQVIDAFEPAMVILAGFMRILTPGFVRHYQGKLLNIHPSLLPKYAGLNTHQRALDAGESYHGATVHFVTEELDGGPAILQASVVVNKNDTALTLASKVLEKEHEIYPAAIQWCLTGKAKLTDGVVHLDDQILPKSGTQWNNEDRH